jgi:pyruvate kinase
MTPVSVYRPHCPVMCVTFNEQAARQVLFSKGSIPTIVDPFRDDQDYLELFISMAKKAKELGLVESGELVVAVSGSSLFKSLPVVHSLTSGLLSTGQGTNVDETFQYQVVSCP